MHATVTLRDRWPVTCISGTPLGLVLLPQLSITVPPHTSVMHTAVTLRRIRLVAPFNGARLGLFGLSLLKLRAAVSALPIIVHAAVTLRLVFPIAPFNGARLGLTACAWLGAAGLPMT